VSPLIYLYLALDLSCIHPIRNSLGGAGIWEVNSTHGLPAPPLMNGMTIKVVHVTNSTYGHHGEMALPQAMLAYDVYG
jgi:hypothetical protein